jgi:murein L,D-transpeptidase YcbB/YkuD
LNIETIHYFGGFRSLSILMKLNTKRNKRFLFNKTFGKRAILFFLLAVLIFSYSCRTKTKPPEHKLVATPQQMNEVVPGIIKKVIQQVIDNAGKLDSINILQPAVLQYLYNKNNNEARWSKDTSWTSAGTALIKFIRDCRLYGLFPKDYHYDNISFIDEKVSGMGEERKDAVLWSKADVLLTDALLQIINDVKLGRLQPDSVTLRTDSALTKDFFEEQVNKIVQSDSITNVIDSLEPASVAYHELKNAIKGFLDSATFKDYTYVPYPIYDTAKFKIALQQRLFEEGLIDSVDTSFDKIKIAKAVKKYQEKNKLTVDGKAGEETIRSMNLTDEEKFIRIALTLDKYKMLPAKMPDKYVWVNLPGYYMQLMVNDTEKIRSKVVVGKPLTRTPELTSSINQMVTYPQWSVPQSIIVKEFLPELKKDPGYLAKKGFSLLDGKNQEVDPYFVDWSKYKKGIPYKIVQGSGDDNALGVMKFNFYNKYAVYLHDTNQRYLFAQSMRALSHGCVRVQQWQKLTDYILDNDSLYVKSAGGNSFTKADSVQKWLVKKEKHFIPVRNKIPLFIRYITCEAKDGKIIFYPDIYNEDRMLGDRYFAKE